MNRKSSAGWTSLSVLVIAVVTLTAVASAQWKEKVLYSFQGPPDGAVPAGAMAFDKAGNLYGVTTLGGVGPCAPTQCGTVFQLQPPATKGGAWTEQVLHIFGGHAKGDGNTPAGGVIFDAAGNLYGTTAYGGTGNCVVLGSKSGCGTVFVMKPPAAKGGKWTEKVLYSFKSGKDGYLPNGDLVFDRAGNLYGATEFGGGFGSCDAPFYQFCGTIFELSPPKVKSGKWTEKVLYHFKSGTDGANPNGGLVLDGVGNIYGTTYAGGNQDCKSDTSVGCGTAFELKLAPAGATWNEILLHRFEINAGEGNPAAGMIFDAKGNLYGTNAGTVFRLTPPSVKLRHWSETILYTFTQAAFGPQGSLIFDPSGNFYGTLQFGQFTAGEVFEMKPAHPGTWTFGILYGFKGSPDGGQPAASLIFDKHGNLYSTTQLGGTGSCSFYGCGTVFVVKP
jgi:hypothetical protein